MYDTLPTIHQTTAQCQRKSNNRGVAFHFSAMANNRASMQMTGTEHEWKILWIETMIREKNRISDKNHGKFETTTREKKNNQNKIKLNCQFQWNKTDSDSNCRMKKKQRWLQFDSFEWISCISSLTEWTLNMRTPNSKNSSKNKL